MYNLELNLYRAYLEARKNGKRKTYDEHIFEINDFENLKNLENSIKNRTYKPSRSEAHIIRKPVIREIFAAPFRDRVVHHLIYNEVADWWDNRFIYDSYSCRKNKGVLFGIYRLDHHIKSVSQNYAKPAYVFKGDIKSFFMSLPREDLLKKALWGLDQQFKNQKDNTKYKTLRFLWEQIVLDDPIKGARKKGSPKNWDDLPRGKSLFHQPKGHGIVIGNLTSQLISNIYLDQLDRFIVHTLGYKHYGRYVDDFYIVIDKSQLEKLKRDIKVIETYLKSLKLTLHPKKRSLKEISQGVDFLGATIRPNRIIPGPRLRKNIKQAFKEVVAGNREPSTVSSYLGHLKYLKSFNLANQVFREVGWDYNPDDLFYLRRPWKGKTKL